MSRRRRTRSESNPGRRSRLTERDLWILEGVGKMRFVTTSQLARLHFEGSRWAANKGLRRLLDARLVRVWIRELAKDNLYSLAPRGARHLQEQDGEEGPRWSVPRGLDGNLDHLLAINQVRVSLALSLPEAGGEIAWWRSDWELRGHGRERVVPDALFEIRWDDGGEMAFALEVDNRTKSPKAFITKMLRYRSALARGRGLYGVRDPVTLLVCRDPRWLERYRLQVAHTRLGSWIWFASLAELEAAGVTGEIWQGAEGPEKYSLRTLAFLPYSKEDPYAESARRIDG
jgi:hypothetical protein